MAQAWKEFMLFRRDKLLILLAVLMPIVLILLSGGTQSLRLRNVPILVYDYDNTPFSRTYLETYGAALTFRLVPNQGESPERALASGIGRAALIIPQNFERDAHRGVGPTVQLLIDASDSNSATGLGNMAAAINGSFDQRYGLAPPPKQTVRLQQRLWFNPGLVSRIYFGTGGLGMMLIIFPALLGALATAKEYEMGTIIQAYASSLTGAQWVLGKALLYIAIGFVEFFLCFAVGTIFFNFHIPTDSTVLVVATILDLMAGVVVAMMLVI